MNRSFKQMAKAYTKTLTDMKIDQALIAYGRM